MDHLIHNTLELACANEKETFFVFNLTDSVAAYQREAHYRVMENWIHNTLDLGSAKYDPEKKRILFLISLTQLQPIKERHITESWTIEYIIHWNWHVQSMILKKKHFLFLISLTQLQPIKERYITDSGTIEYITRWNWHVQSMILKKKHILF